MQPPSVEVRGVVAIDGKLMRGPSKCDENHTTGREGFKLWMVSAWAASNSISLGQVKVDEKSNEITAIPQLLRALELEGCIITIDAMGCQKEITKEIISRKADYIIALKENQKNSYEEVKAFMADYEDCNRTGRQVSRHISENTGHGRFEKRTCTILSYGEITERMFRDRFVGLRFIVSLKSERTMLATRKHTVEYRYYITSLDNSNPEEIASAIRQHWSIENNLHWQLDVTFREDQSRKVKNAARNYSAVSKMALSILKNDKTVKGSINLKRLKAGWDDEYLSRLLQGNAF